MNPIRFTSSSIPKPVVLVTRVAVAAAIVAMRIVPAHAAGSSMPWEQPLQQILESVEGPVAKIVAVVL
ncbi:conjugal transfer protein TrbC, partial [Mesorhizobium sp. M7A.F.Ca.US.014.04.1.1]|uniref:TrbC/VirB2 family protein n=1 Tax=Mesorhizobium sp. M7A.F.Ca.US.014.04.1.1 TaxID=2496744 RepID=UPI000FD2B2D1